MNVVTPSLERGRAPLPFWLRQCTLVLPLLLACWLLSRATGAAAVTASLASLLLLSVGCKRPLRFSREIQLLVAVLLVFTLGAILVSSWEAMVDRGIRSPLDYTFGTLGLVLSAYHCYLHKPHGGEAVVLGLGLGVVVTGGMGQPSDGTYSASVLIYVVLAGIAMNFNDPSRPLPLSFSRRGWLSTLALWGGTLVFALAFITLIPQLHEKLEGWSPNWWRRPQSGFSDGPLRLGSMRDMLLSQEKVMRVHGELDDPYLRGKVLQSYRAGKWSEPDSATATVRLETAIDDPSVSIDVLQYGWDRFFVPLHVRDLETRPGVVEASEFGIVKVESSSWGAKSVKLVVGTRPGLWDVCPPSDRDLEVPGELRQMLDELLTQWLGSEEERSELSPATRIALLKSRLSQHCEYSLQIHVPAGDDPVKYFLTSQRRGHCEYFASALALLARRAKVHTRVVTGFLATEHNAFGDYLLVRQQDAHAWVEYYQPKSVGFGGEWFIADATPPSLLAPRRDTSLSALWDAGVVFFKRVGWVFFVAVLLIAWGLIVLRRRSRRQAAAPSRQLEPFGEPPEYLERFLRRLSLLGYERDNAESLESLARRVRARLPRGEEAATLLEAYSAVRYGGFDEAVVARQIRDWLAYSITGSAVVSDEVGVLPR